MISNMNVPVPVAILAAIAAAAPFLVLSLFLLLPARTTPPPPVATLDTYLERKRVTVTGADRFNGWRGVVVDVLDDALLLEATETLTKRDNGEVATEHVPGVVVIPRSRILTVQIVTD